MKPRAELQQSAPMATRARCRRRDDLAAGADPDASRMPGADQRVVDEHEALAHRGPHVIGELERRGAGAALAAVDDDEVGMRPVSSIAFTMP